MCNITKSVLTEIIKRTIIVYKKIIFSDGIGMWVKPDLVSGLFLPIKPNQKLIFRFQFRHFGQRRD